MARQPRPLSPHLLIYRPQLTSVLSITHRLTGVVLGAGALLLTWWLIAAVEGPESFDEVQSIIGSWWGRLFLFGFTVALFYHLCNGIRHLLWDLGYGLELRSVYRSGWTVVIATVVLTLLSWALGYAIK
jgi:succinate dehydrogenase / fumarate reductase cytochrome b subunit